LFGIFYNFRAMRKADHFFTPDTNQVMVVLPHSQFIHGPGMERNLVHHADLT
jgi:hypothetical protein